MPIEFRCGNCSKLLRTPDESAGKKAKCPQCGTVVDVPAAGASPVGPLSGGAPPNESPPSKPSSSNDASPGIPAASGQANPFGASGSAPSRAPDDFNPYASPGMSSNVQEAKPASDGVLTHGTISFDDILRTSWSIASENLGPVAIFGLVLFGSKVALTMLVYAVNFTAGLAGIPAIAVVSQMFTTTVNFVATMWLSIVTIMF